MGGARLVNGERDGALEAAPDNGDIGVRKRSGERQAASIVGETGRTDAPSMIAEEDETLYSQYLAARIPPAVP